MEGEERKMKEGREGGLIKRYVGGGRKGGGRWRKEVEEGWE